MINVISFLFQSPWVQESSEDGGRLSLKIRVSKVILTILADILSPILLAAL